MIRYSAIFFALVTFILIGPISMAYSATLAAAEYFIDNDPGEGAGIPLTAADGIFNSEVESVSLTGLEISSLSSGEHNIFVRFQDSEGVWGVAKPASFDTRYIAGAEYFIDIDPGQGSGEPIAAVDGSFDSAVEQINRSGIDLSGLNAGRHILYMRFQESSGVWGMPSAYPFNVSGNLSLAAAEYFIDLDPGVGLGTPLNPVDGVFDEPEEDFLLPDFDTTGFKGGNHLFYLRLKDSDGNWGVARQSSFEIYTPATLAAAEYFIDSDPGPGNGIAVMPRDGIFDSTEEIIDVANIETSDLEVGEHTFSFRFRDDIGRWGAERSQTFMVLNPLHDQDGDGINNQWESDHGLNPQNGFDAGLDPDGDGLSNLEEFQLSTDPFLGDSDGDGLPDGWEFDHGLDPLTDDAILDPDGDGLSNQLEYDIRTNPQSADTDGDGVNDGLEVQAGTNPRAFSSSLTSDTSGLTLSLGASKTVNITLSNASRQVDTFDLSVSGIQPEWYTLDENRVTLSAGEKRTLPLRLNIPQDCGIWPLGYELEVSAVSLMTGAVKNGGLTISLELVTAPIISGIVPGEGDKLATNGLQVLWQTDAVASTELFYRPLGSSPYQRVEGEPGKEHRAIIEGLTWDSSYEWYVRSQGSCGANLSAVRNVTIVDGVVFGQRAFEFTIPRDYDQRFPITITNRDVVEHTVLVEVINPYHDLITGFIGSGSVDEALILAPGESSEVIVALHAQDATHQHYELGVRLIADADSGNPILDYAAVNVAVQDTSFILQVEELARDPNSLTNSYRITNHGDTITDLNAFFDGNSAPYVSLNPGIEHGMLSSGESIVVNASFQPPTESIPFSGNLNIAGAGKQESVALDFTPAANTSEYIVDLENVSVCLPQEAWYCTNRPEVEANLDIPLGISPENITGASLYLNNSPMGSGAPQEHNVEVWVNDDPIATLSAQLQQKIPSGAYSASIPPKILNASSGSVGKNKVQFITTHLNNGHYQRLNEIELQLNVSRMSQKIYAASQEEANQKAQELPFLCSGQPPFDVCPRVESLRLYNRSGIESTSYVPGDTVAIRASVLNPGTDSAAVGVEFYVGENRIEGSGGSYALQAGESKEVGASYQIPAGSEGKEFQISVRVTGAGSCAERLSAPVALEVNHSFNGKVIDHNTGEPLEGVIIIGGSASRDQEASDISQSDGTFSLSLPKGKIIIVAGKEGYSTYKNASLRAPENSGLVIELTKQSSLFGWSKIAGYIQDPVNTATGNFIHEEKDLSFKGRGLNFSFERFYNSQDSYNGPLGYGWTHNYNYSVSVDGRIAILKHGDGREEVYRSQGSEFVGQAGADMSFAVEADGTITLTDREQKTYRFDVVGRLISISDRNKNSILCTYQEGNLVSITDPVGRMVQFSYDVEGRIIQLQDPLGRIITYGYDENGDLVSVADVMGNALAYSYDSNHQMLTAQDARGTVYVSNTYDEQRRVVSLQRDALGNVSTFEYDATNQVTLITDPLGQRWSHHYDNFNRLVRAVDPKRNETIYEYDQNNKRVGVTDKRGFTTRYEYDTSGNRIGVVDPLGHRTSFAYDALNNPISKTDALGHNISFVYDASGNLISVIDPLGGETVIEVNAHGLPVQITDPRGNTTMYAYDGEGNLVQETDALGNISQYGYDAVGRLISVTDALGNVTSYAYDDADRLIAITDPTPLDSVEQFEYDANGNRTRVIDRRGNATEFTYDVKNRLVLVTDPLGHTVETTYDALDRRETVTDKRGMITRFGYDGAGSLIEVIGPLGHVTRRSYDGEGNLLKIVDPEGGAFSCEYDAAGHLTAVRDSIGNTTRLNYDGVGRVLSRTDANGNTTGYEYDPLGRLAKVVEPGGGETAYFYDRAGNKVAFKNALGNTFTYEYDSLGRLIRDADGYLYRYDATGNLVSRTDAKGQELLYNYDPMGRLIKKIYPDANSVTYTYDATGNLVRMVDSIGATTRQYDPLNRIISSTDPFGSVVGYNYDPAGNLQTLVYPDGAAVTYKYDKDGRLTTVTDWQNRITTYTYNNAGKLVSTVYPNGTTSLRSYDEIGRLRSLTNRMSVQEVLSSYDFTLDAVGNRVVIDVIEPRSSSPDPINESYVYDSENRLISINEDIFSYDTNGSLVSKSVKGIEYSFKWNFDNQLVGLSDGENVYDFSYNGEGDRVGSSRNQINTRYVLDSRVSFLSNVIYEDLNDGSSGKYIYGLGLIGKEDKFGVRYFHYDPIGNTIALTDMNKNVKNAYSYDSFGSINYNAEVFGNRFKFAGKYGVSEEIGSIKYIRKRYYDSSIGRFIQKDPYIGSSLRPKSLHRYAYVENNPISYVDITGLFKEHSSNFYENGFFESKEKEHIENGVISGGFDIIEHLNSPLGRRVKNSFILMDFLLVGHKNYVNSKLDISDKIGNTATHTLINGSIIYTATALGGPVGFIGGVAISYMVDKYGISDKIWEGLDYLSTRH